MSQRWPTYGSLQRQNPSPYVPCTHFVDSVSSSASVSASTSVPEKASPSLKDVSSELSKSLALSRELNEERVREAVEEINKELFKLQSELGFSVDKVANDIVVTVKRKESGEVVRQIPSEIVLKLAHNFEKLKGVFLDDFS